MLIVKKASNMTKDHYYLPRYKDQAESVANDRRPATQIPIVFANLCARTVDDPNGNRDNNGMALMTNSENNIHNNNSREATTAPTLTNRDSPQTKQFPWIVAILTAVVVAGAVVGGVCGSGGCGGGSTAAEVGQENAPTTATTTTTLSPTPATDIWSVYTNTTYGYRMWDVSLGETHCITFKVKASNDVHIGFFPSYQEIFPVEVSGTPGFYEIVIGGWGDTWSVVRDGGQGTDQGLTNQAQGWLDKSTYTPFWACVRNDTVSMGQGETVGLSVISCHHFEGVKRTVQYVGFSTGWGSDGYWIDIKKEVEDGPNVCSF